MKNSTKFQKKQQARSEREARKGSKKNRQWVSLQFLPKFYTESINLTSKGIKYSKLIKRKM